MSLSKWRIGMLLFFLSVMSCGCNQGQKNRIGLTKLGLLGERPLKRLDPIVTSTGTIQGAFFLGSGSISGEENTDFNIHFIWSAEHDRFFRTTLPAGKIVWQIDNSKNEPTIEFVFDQSHLDATYGNGENPNLNEYLETRTTPRFEYAIVRISNEMIQHNVYLKPDQSLIKH